MASHFASDPKKTPRSGRSGGVPTISAGRPRGASAASASSYSRASGNYSAKSRRGGGGRRGGAGKKVAIVLGVLLAVILVAGGTVGVMLYRSAMSVRAQASEVMSTASVLTDAIKSGETEALDTAVADVQEQMASINAEVNTPLWNVATLIPVVGQDIRSVQLLCGAGSELIDEALVPIARSVSGVGLSSLFQDGAINVGLIQDISDALSDSLPAIQGAVDTIASLPEAHIPQLAEVLGRVQEPVSSMKVLVDDLDSVFELIPQMLGGGGETRTYLIVAQNNAELRSTGGLPGSWGALTITDGVMEIGDFESILHDAGLQVSATDEERAAIDINFDTDPAQLNYLPDFGRVGELAREYWQQKGYGTVDGVIAIDPVFLQRLLGLTGGFESSDGSTVDGTNAAQVLLSDTYWKLGNDGSAQDDYFASVAGDSFDHIVENLGSADFTKLINVITESGEDGRLLVWMENEDEEELMVRLGVDGRVGTDPTTPELGVYLNDDTYSKISWYAACNTQVSEGVANADGTTTYDVTTTLTNTITSEVAASAPSYVSGVRNRKTSVDEMFNHIFILAPAGGTISNLSVNDSAFDSGYGLHETTLYGLQTYRLGTRLYAGESAVITYQVTVSADATEPLAVRTTPLAQEALMEPLG